VPDEDASEPKPVRWIGSSRDDLRAFPEDVRLRVGGALWEAQLGRKAGWAKPLKGFGGAGVLEVVDDFDGDTFRAVYTVRFAGVIYVLHAFQKKSKSGIATPRHEIALIEQRLKRAKEDYDQWIATQKSKSR
jgi:phage-related protein